MQHHKVRYWLAMASVYVFIHTEIAHGIFTDNPKAF